MDIVAQIALKRCLAAGDLSGAEMALDQGASLHPDTATSQNSLWWAALGPADAFDAQQVAGWTWLESRGFDLPRGQAACKVVEKVLRGHPMVLADWLEARRETLGWDPSPAMGNLAVRRKDLVALKWLHARHWLLSDVEPSTSLCLSAVEKHQLKALPHVSWLAVHGFIFNPEEKPLVHIAINYKAQSDKHYAAGKEPPSLSEFIELWTCLVNMGANPGAKWIGRKNALELIQATPAETWQRALNRQASSTTTAVPASCRPRPRQRP